MRFKNKTLIFAVLFTLSLSVFSAYTIEEVENSKVLSELSKSVLKEFKECQKFQCNEQGYISYIDETLTGPGGGNGPVSYTFTAEGEPRKIVFSGNSTVFGIFKVTIYLRDDLNIEYIGLRDSIFGIVGITSVRPTYEFHPNGNLKKSTESIPGFEEIIEYDSNGNMINKTQTLGSGEIQTTTYNPETQTTTHKTILPDESTITEYNYENGTNKTQEIYSDKKITIDTTKTKITRTEETTPSEGRRTIKIISNDLTDGSSLESDEIILPNGKRKLSESDYSKDGRVTYLKKLFSIISYTDGRKFTIIQEYSKPSENNRTGETSTMTIIQSDGTEDTTNYIKWEIWNQHDADFQTPPAEN